MYVTQVVSIPGRTSARRGGQPSRQLPRAASRNPGSTDSAPQWDSAGPVPPSSALRPVKCSDAPAPTLPPPARPADNPNHNNHPIIRPSEPVPSPTPSKRLDPIALRPWQRLWLRHFQSHAGALPPPLFRPTMPRLTASLICGSTAVEGGRPGASSASGRSGARWDPATLQFGASTLQCMLAEICNQGSARCLLPLFSIDLLDIRSFEPR